MASESTISLSIPAEERLAGSANYLTWRWQIQTILELDDLWEIVTEESSGSDSDYDTVSVLGQNDDRRVKDKRKRKALSILKRSVSKDLIPYLLDVKTPHECWTILKSICDVRNSATRLAAYQNFCSLKMDTGMLSADFLRRVKSVVNQLTEYGDRPSDEMIIERVLNALPQRYENAVRGLSYNKRLPSIEELAGILQLEDDREKNRDHDEDITALVAKLEKAFVKKSDRPPQATCTGDTYRPPHIRSQGNQNLRQTRGAKSEPLGEPRKHYDKQVRCERCGRLGHAAPKCRISFRRIRSEDLEGMEANLTPIVTGPPSEEPDQDIQDFLTGKNESNTATSSDFHALSVEANSFESEAQWILDSGASRHLTGSSDGIGPVRSLSPTSSVTSASGIVHSIKGVTDVQVNLNGEVSTISDVLYVPSMKKHLLSVGQLADKGLLVIFDKDKCTVVCNKAPYQLLALGKRASANGLYYLCRYTPATQPVPTTSSDSHLTVCTASITDVKNAKLWHGRLGHSSYESLHYMTSRQTATGLPDLSKFSEFCPECLAGKQTREPFPAHSETRATTVLQLLHADLCGPFPVPSKGGARYILMIVDDYSRRGWAIPLKLKSDTLDQFIVFCKQAEAETGQRVRGLRTDRGGEFLSKAFIQFCHTHGIHMQLTVAATPQQNGVAERRNRMLLEKMRSLMISCDAPKPLWAEAILTSNYLINVIPTRANSGVAPDTLYFKKRPNLAHLRLFGCRAYAHVPAIERSKLDSKTRLCMMLGYDSASKAYRLFDPLTGKIRISRDVKFHEDILGLPSSRELLAPIPDSLSFSITPGPLPSSAVTTSSPHQSSFSPTPPRSSSSLLDSHDGSSLPSPAVTTPLCPPPSYDDLPSSPTPYSAPSDLESPRTVLSPLLNGSPSPISPRPGPLSLVLPPTSPPLACHTAPPSDAACLPHADSIAPLPPASLARYQAFIAIVERLPLFVLHTELQARAHCRNILVFRSLHNDVPDSFTFLLSSRCGSEHCLQQPPYPEEDHPDTHHYYL
ncbi:hypothetical protein R1sor_009430 [Riccia sorocarpa]|uniref:Polyprotein n=1 Tax=Riccia sorocarpa TaxID=122646 RepID=A0ABD3HYF7_9MARC